MIVIKELLIGGMIGLGLAGSYVGSAKLLSAYLPTEQAVAGGILTIFSYVVLIRGIQQECR